MKLFNHSYVRGLLTGALAMIAFVALFTLSRSDSSAQRPAPTSPANPANPENPASPVNPAGIPAGIPAGTPGRYQLINGLYSAAMGGKNAEYRDLFKIDTETGATWIYEAQPTKDGYVNGWSRINDLQRR